MDLCGLHADDWSWLQSLDLKVKKMSWEEFCQLVLDHFGRDQYELLIRQLFHIC